MKRKLYIISLLFTISAVLSGLISLFPYEGTSFTSLLGYKAFCTFNPASSLFCFLAAGISCFIRSTFLKYETGSFSEKIKKHKIALIPLTLLLITALTFSFQFYVIQKGYTDGTTQASESIEDY